MLARRDGLIAVVAPRDRSERTRESPAALTPRKNIGSWPHLRGLKQNGD